ncbi:MAG: type II toxin-antitoxin system VapC family toxin [Armatimonadota bacterium]
MRTSGSVPLLDVNIVMYAAGREHPYKAPCQAILTQIAQGNLIVAIDVEIIQEILHRYGAQGRHNEAVQLATDLLTLVPLVYPVTAQDVHRAIELFQRYAPQGIRSRDVIHIAIMLNNGIHEIISTDKHFDMVADIRRIDPMELYAQT